MQTRIIHEYIITTYIQIITLIVYTRTIICSIVCAKLRHAEYYMAVLIMWIKTYSLKKELRKHIQQSGSIAMCVVYILLALQECSRCIQRFIVCPQRMKLKMLMFVPLMDLVMTTVLSVRVHVYTLKTLRV